MGLMSKCFYKKPEKTMPMTFLKPNASTLRKLRMIKAYGISSRCKIRIQTHTINSMLSDRVQCNNSRLRTAPCEKQKTTIMFQNITTAQSKRLAHIAAHLSADV